MSQGQQVEIRQTAEFESWLNGLADRSARARIVSRLTRVELGNFGDVAPVGSGISELRFHFGAGYRVYFVQHGGAVVLLCGGEKGTQQRDIARAIQLAKGS